MKMRTVSRLVFAILGYPIAQVSREIVTGPDELANPRPDSMTEHGISYSCSRCREVLIQGLPRRLHPADEQALISHHTCEEPK